MTLQNKNHRPARWPPHLLAATMLSACNTFTRLSQVGEEPELSKIQNPGGDPADRDDADADADAGRAPGELAVAAGRARLLQGPARQPDRRHPDGDDQHRRHGQPVEQHHAHAQQLGIRGYVATCSASSARSGSACPATTTPRSIPTNLINLGSQSNSDRHRPDHSATTPSPCASRRSSPRSCRTATSWSRAPRKCASISRPAS